MAEKFVVGFMTEVIKLGSPEWILRIATVVLGSEPLEVAVTRGMATKLGAALSRGNGIADPQNESRKIDFFAAAEQAVSVDRPALDALTRIDVERYEVKEVAGRATSLIISGKDLDANDFAVFFDQTATFMLHQDLLDAMDRHR